jgi:azurin
MTKIIAFGGKPVTLKSAARCSASAEFICCVPGKARLLNGDI